MGEQKTEKIVSGQNNSFRGNQCVVGTKVRLQDTDERLSQRGRYQKHRETSNGHFQ